MGAGHFARGEGVPPLRGEADPGLAWIGDDVLVALEEQGQDALATKKVSPKACPE